MYPDSSDGLNKETDDAVYFFTPAFDPFNNFSAHAITLWGRTFPTAEHAYQWKKFSEENPELSEKILVAGSPEAVKKISDAHKTKMPHGWHEKKIAVMEEILRAKARQHDDVRDALRRSGKRTIVENSPVDDFWGTGSDGRGENWMGKILMTIRDNV